MRQRLGEAMAARSHEDVLRFARLFRPLRMQVRYRAVHVDAKTSVLALHVTLMVPYSVAKRPRLTAGYRRSCILCIYVLSQPRAPVEGRENFFGINSLSWHHRRRDYRNSDGTCAGS